MVVMQEILDSTEANSELRHMRVEIAATCSGQTVSDQPV